MRLINFLAVAATAPVWILGFMWNKAEAWFSKGVFDSETIDSIEIERYKDGWK